MLGPAESCALSGAVGDENSHCAGLQSRYKPLSLLSGRGDSINRSLMRVETEPSLQLCKCLAAPR